MGSSPDRKLYLNNPAAAAAQRVFSSKGTSSWIMTPFGVLDVTAMRPSSWAIRLLITLKPRTRPWLVDIEVRRQTNSLI